MILTCPACGTKYTVKDGAIPPGGRQVRCANCKHSWHQDPDEGSAEPGAAAAVAPVSGDQPAAADDTAPAVPTDEPAPERGWPDHAHPDASASAVEADPDAAPLPEPTPAPVEGGWNEPAPAAEPEPAAPEPQTLTGMPTTYERVPKPEPEPLPYSVAHDPALATPALPAGEEGWVPPAATVPAASPVDMDFAVYESGHEEFSGSKGKLLLGLLIALVVIIAAVAAFWFLAPSSFKQRLGVAAASDTLLKVQVDQRSRRTLASGQQVLEVSGKVINPSDRTQPVPPLQAQLRSLDQQVVYRWTIPAPAQTLQPGGSASFNSAELNIPASAACLDVWVNKQEPLKACKADATGASAG